MSAKFLIQSDRDKGLVRFILAGFFSAADFARLLPGRDRAYAALNLAPNQHVTLVDVRRLKIQSPEMVEAFGSMLSDRSFRSRRIAFITGRTLVRSQLIRALAGRDACCFETVEDAEAYLFSGACDEKTCRRAA
jgi:hypothetical protein